MARVWAIMTRTSTACWCTIWTLHVPWIIRLPNRMLQGTAIEQPVGLVDMMPTVLDLVGAPVPADTDGRR